MHFATQRFTSRAQLTEALIKRLETYLAGARAPGGPTALMLAGGSTPLPAYREVARRLATPVPQLRILYSDDRYVAATSEASNYHQSEPLLAALALAPGQVIRVRTELPLDEAALDYEAQLATLLRSGARVGLGLLGLGADGHTASLFTQEHLAAARGHLAIAVQRPDGMAGVTVTPDFLSQAEELLFVVSGGGKYDALQALRNQDPRLVALLAVQGCPKVELWADQEALFSLMA
jgi:6-phosphogluconolactonase